MNFKDKTYYKAKAIEFLGLAVTALLFDAIVLAMIILA